MPEIRIPIKHSSVSASVHGRGETTVVLGHGAGGDRRSGLLVRLADALASSGRQTVLYNFPYAEEGRRRPDPGSVLETAADAVARYTAAELGARRLVLGGKSMGGRIASQAAAKGTPAHGLVFLGYPLHPPGKTDQQRDRHLPLIEAPMLFVQGTRDAFARWDLVEAVVSRLGERATLLPIEGGDHSFALRGSGGRVSAPQLDSARRIHSDARVKKVGRAAAEVEAEIAAAILGWLEAKGL